MHKSSDRELLLIFPGLLAIILGFVVLWRVPHPIAQVVFFIAVPEGALLIAYALGILGAGDIARQRMLEEMEQRLVERERSLSQRVEELSILHELSLAASKGVRSDEVLDNAAHVMERVLSYPHLALFLVDSASGVISVHSGYGPGLDMVMRAGAAVGKGITGIVAQTGLSENLPDVSKDPRYVALMPDTRSELCVPMRIGDRVIGGINVESPQLDAFDSHDVRFLTTIANQLAISIDNARLLSEATRRSAHLAGLNAGSRTMSAQLERQQLLGTMVEVASQVFGANSAAVFCWDEQRQELRIAASRGLSEQYVARQTIPGDRIVAAVEDGGWQPVTLSRSSLHRLVLHPDLAVAEELPAALLVPLAAGSNLLGVLLVSARGEDPGYSTQDIEMAQIFAGQAVISLENARLFSEASKAREMLALQRIAGTISSSLDLNEVLRTIVAVTCEVMNCPKAAIFELDETIPALRLVVAHGVSDAFVDEWRRLPPVGRQRRATSSGHPVIVEDIESNEGYAPFVDIARREGFRAFVDVPMRSKGKVVGVLSAYYPEPHAFDQAEIELLTTVANQAAMTMENARLHGQTDTDLRRRVDELTALRQISLRLVSSLDLNTVLNAIAESTLRLVHASDVHIFLYDEARQALSAGTALWASGERRTPVVFLRPDGITMTAVRERRPIVVDDAALQPLYATPEVQDWGVKAIACFPLLRAQAAIGAFNVAFAEPHTFTEDELRVLTLLADQAAIAVENARLHERLAEQAKRDSLTQVYNHGYLLESLTSAVEDAKQNATPVSFILLDIDHFKDYNDRYGHVVGDAVLRAIVQSISANIKRSDVVGRWGGEEFGVVLPEASSDQAERVAQRIRDTVARLDLRNGEDARMPNPTVSQGIATFPVHAHSADELVARADQALYSAKSRGRDQVVIAA